MTVKISSILKNKKQYNVDGMLWIEIEGARCFGPGRMQLLQGIAKTGSLNKAAKEINMSYKKAWTMITELNEQFSEPMVIMQSGGEGGGGSTLTDAAKTLMDYHTKLRERFIKFLENETGKLNK